MQHTTQASMPHSEPQAATAQRISALKRNSIFVTLVILIWCAMASSALAQNVQFTQGGVGSGLDNSIQIPIQTYPGRGGASLPVTLYYSSKVWRLDNLTTLNYGTYYQSVAQAIYAQFSTAGWKTSLDLPIIEWPKSTDTYYYSGGPQCIPCTGGIGGYRIRRVFLHMPDGSTHELRQDDIARQESIVQSGTFYAVDGSRLRFDATGASTGTVFLPDGTRYILNGGTAQFIDRNGNTLNYDASTRQWTDTLGRVIGIPLPADPSALPVNADGTRTFTYTGKGINLPGVNTDRTYTFVWKNLSDALTPDPTTNQTPTRLPVGSEYLPNPNAMPNTNPADNQPQYQSQGLFNEDSPDDGANTLVIGQMGTAWAAHNQLFNPVVLAEVDLPNGLSYKFSYNIYGEIDKVTYPTGGSEIEKYDVLPSIGDTSVPYTQANRGVVQRQLNAGDGSSPAIWDYSSTGGVVTTVAPDNTVTESYRQSFSAPQVGNKILWPFGLEDARNGMVYDERAYAPGATRGAKGQMLRRSLTQWDESVGSVPPRTGAPSSGNNTDLAYRNPRPSKEVSLMLDTGGDALAKTVTYQYDTTNQFTTGVDRTLSTESYFTAVSDPNTAQTGGITFTYPTVSTAATSTITIASGPIASSAVTTYVDSSNPNYASYQSRNILGLVKSVVLEDANNQPVSKTETIYDEASYMVSISGQATAWTDPGTTVRGLPTTVRHYVTLSPDTYLESHVTYDQWGNARSAIDARGNQSTVDYSATYSYAYPTQTTSAVPAPSNSAAAGHGSTTAFTSTSVFDSNTGLVLSTTDANNQTTTFSYTDANNVVDAMNRLRKVTRADGSFTTTDYHDSQSDIAGAGMYVETKSSLDATRVTKAQQYFDKLGRSVRSFAFEASMTATPWIVSDTYYDQMGRVSQVSNPYRTATPSASVPTTCALCTSSVYDALGRVTQVTLPDATTVQTSYQGIYTTVTDQAGKQRRQKVDALGRVVRVDEPDTSGSLGSVTAPAQPSFYQYNTQGNLIAISQGLTQTGANPEDAASYLQHRYFKFDALSRLTYERQVEQAATITISDALTGNSQWSRHLSYDENGYQGLPTSMVDARGVSTQYSYDNLNRIYRVSYSDGTPAVNSYYDQARTGYVNQGHLTTVTTDAVAAQDPVPAIPATAQSYDYDLMGRIVHQQETIGSNTPYTLTYGYNLGGELTSETYPSGRVVSYGYNDAAGLSSVTSGTTTYASHFDYSRPDGVLKSVTLGNGAVESYDYNSRLQLNSINLAKDSNTLQRYEYKYGVVGIDGSVDETKNNGQLGRIEGYIGTNKQWQQRFSYDSLGRLSQASEYRGDNNQQSYQNTYDYDSFGNRYQKAAHQSNPLPYIAVEDSDINQATNRFTSSQITYDDVGNIKTDNKFTAHQYTYDANNRQRTVTRSDGVGGLYTSVYDGAGQRVATINNGVTNYLVYDASGKLVAEYGQTVNQNGTSYIFSDQQGSTRAVMNQSGSVISRHDYQAFGGEIQAGVGMRTSTQDYGASDSARQKYAGMETDDGSTLEHTLWRKYDSQSGRWTSPDPYGGSMSVSSPQSFNRYSYVNNDPVNKTDSLGLMAGADKGYGSFEGWGGTSGLDDPHFGGPGIISEAEARYDHDMHDLADERLVKDYLKKGKWKDAKRVLDGNSDVGLDVDGEELWGGDAADYVQGERDTTASLIPDKNETTAVEEGDGISTAHMQGKLDGPYIMDDPIKYEGTTCGNGECAQFPQIIMISQGHPMGLTNQWRQGTKVFGNSSIQRGTIMASGWENGRYPGRSTGNHVAVFLEFIPNGFRVIEQVHGHIQVRNVDNSKGSYFSNPNYYFVVLSRVKIY